jgi:uncharacterized protein YyaL (SSP411 family)
MNRLAGESSPYLLQHAHNPVDWYPWGEEALQKAKAEDKPILVSIGYSACHWCHVMEKESFEDEGTAEIMNQLFVNIKVDREERPDVDHIYMDAVQAMSGSGGWPLNVFLTPEGRPFYGGTYFPPVRAYNRASWKEVLHGLHRAFKENREQIEDQARQLTEHLQQANSFGTSPVRINIPAAERFLPSQLEQAFVQVMGQADKAWGGFGRAPKFPQTFTIGFLLRHHHYTGSREALDQAALSLDKMIMGGIYDHIGGGFARYSTDTEWLVPHFEKMLYDNALLVMVLADAWQITGEERYARTIRETLRFVETELMSPEGGFYSALDADSEGVEGKYYVWTAEEVDETLGAGDSRLFRELYDISAEGNWEQVNIPRLKQWPAAALLDQLDVLKNKLAQRRSGRVKPGLDDKILLSWNALMNKAFSRAAEVLGDDHYLEIARRNMDFLLEVLADGSSGRVLHVYKNGVAKVDGFLDDIAYMASALVQLAEVSLEPGYLELSRVFIEEAIAHYSDEEGLFFYFTRDSQQDLLVRKKEVYDGATPSGNGVMANVLLDLSILLERREWGERAAKMADSLSQMALRYPTSFGIWTSLIQQLAFGTLELVIVGEGAKQAARRFLRENFVPNKVFQASETSQETYPLLKDKVITGQPVFYLCREYSCQKPVMALNDFVQLVDKEPGTKY